MDNKAKTIALYKYIQELCALKYRIVTDVEKQHWVRYLKDIPNDTDNISVFYRDRTEEEPGDDTVLVTVRKPEFQRCPEPGTVFVDWLQPGWDHYTNDVNIKESITEGSVEYSDSEQKEPERFDDSTQRIRAFDKWNEQRTIWVEKQRVINKTRRFFAQLFQIYTDLERESETIEMMVGNGIVKVNGDNSINHPIMLKRVKMQFDAEANVISIHDTDTEPELYTLLLQEVHDIHHNAIKQLKEELRENFYHPMDRNDSPDFLKILTHKLCSDSRFVFDDNDNTVSKDRLTTTLNPVFFVRKRIDGTFKAIEEIIRNIDNTGYIPKHLLELVEGGIVEIPEEIHEQSIVEQLASVCGESTSILLSMEANREQLEIAERIERYNAVLVQGPPGTGKTHTIANLLGHFLAQGKSVLVTSHTKKALAVLKEKVPDEIKDLCVSILDDTNLDMVSSVDGISDYMSRHTMSELKKKVESDTRQRTDIIKQLAEVRKKIYAIKYKEFKPIVYNGESYSLSQVAEFVNANTEDLSYIPGKVLLYHPLPLSTEQLISLYRSNKEISVKEEQELQYDIPSPDSILNPSVFSEDLRRSYECKKAIDDIASKLNIGVKIDAHNAVLSNPEVTGKPIIHNPNTENLYELSKYANTFNNIDGWMIHAAVDGRKGGGYRQRWEMLINSIEETSACANSLVTQSIGYQIEINTTVESTQLQTQLQKLSELFQKNRKISKLDLLLNKSYKETLKSIRINGMPLASKEDCLLVQAYLILQERRNMTAQIWNELMAKHGSPEFFALGDDPEQIGFRMIPSIKRYLDWYQNEYAQLMEIVERSGINSEYIFCKSEFDSEIVQAQKTLLAAQEQLPLFINLAENLIVLSNIERRKNQLISLLSNGERKRSAVCISLIRAITDENQESYKSCYYQLSMLHAKLSLKASRDEYLTKLEASAPEWADAIRNRVGIHGSNTCPDTIEDAWKWNQFVRIIDSIIAEPYEELQHRAVMLSKELRRITEKVAASKAWYHLLLRSERNLSMRQALIGWKLTIKKIGRGTGRNAPELKKQARMLMAECQAAVPAWIMTINAAMENLNPASNSFDVIIIDEASQSDISALGILYMAKKIIIVGDDKQVSPMAVGIDIDKMNALRDMYIKGIIPGWHLYDAKTSLYDIAATTFQPLMLKEHFRCHPDIIGYSNKLSYDFKIKPLRDTGNCPISPPVVNFRVSDGARSDRQKTNLKEAETIVALMMACIEQKEYQGMTFGAITLLGNEQAQIIQQIILQRIDPIVIEQRGILCGNASHFQGDERNVVFLSLVDNNEGEGYLTMAGEGADQSRKQRYNVAASRAKDQLWVVHSLDYTRDLQAGDLRRDLLEYTENPKAFTVLAENVEAAAESPFEEAVAKSLVASGYHIVQQWSVGAYRIDIVVLYQGDKVAIECDGEKFHSGEEKIRADMERQTILERIKWRFIRIRGSEYYRDPDNTMERVKRDLATFGIFPEKVTDEQTNYPTSDLLERVKIRAAQILDKWHIENEELGVVVPDDSIIKFLPEQPVLVPVNETDSCKQMTLLFSQSPTIQKATARSTKATPRQVKNRSSKNTQSVVEPITRAKTGGAKDSPSLSKGLALIEMLNSAQIYYIDNRGQSGIIWVPLVDDGKERIEGIISGCGLKYSFEKRGAKATDNKPAWRVMSD